MVKTRRTFTDKKRAEICAYDAEHGHKATMQKYRLVSSVLYNICKRAEKLKSKSNGAQRVTGVEALLLLRRAKTLIEEDVRGGGQLRSADSYMLMALNMMEGSQ